ncbi:4-hydroxy-3-methylbut-2-enyl diphosphate reductase [Candidatus Woesearchaeota archaeon]|nr:4-hydroxy-3-methylbut-2-enyl diphosphate reductase [Candidatus Woesearchaeota archaeon]
MNIKLAEEAGFCFGVKRALDRVDRIKDKDDVYVLGRLIHNPQVIGELKKQGVRFIEDIDEINHGTLVISAHGVSDRIMRGAREKNLDIIDTTCPLVTNVHNITRDLEKQGYRVMIFGDRKHTEVRGVMGNLKDPIVISDISEIQGMEEGRYALVSQTTNNVAEFEEISRMLKDRIKGLVIKDTICSATKLRQESAKRLARESDLMIVIGGYNSANTRSLASICSGITETRHIENADELRKEWFEGKENIGVSAGASTPENVIREVIDRIKCKGL